MKKTILITGGAGFVGSNLAIFLKRKLKNSRIVCFDNLIRRGSTVNVKRLKENHIVFLKGDIRNTKQLSNINNIKLIIDCAAEPSVLAAYRDPEYSIQTNLMGTVNCLNLALKQKSAFIFLSTSRVYPIDALESIPYQELSSRFDWKRNCKGQGFSYKGISQQFPLNGYRSLYGMTKLSSELLALEYFNMFGITGLINRLGMIAGPWQMGKIDQGLVGYWMARHKFRKPLSFIGYGGKGKQVRDVLHVEDACELIFQQILNLKRLHSKTYNVGGGRKNSISLQELTKRVQNLTKVKLPVKSVSQNRQSDIRIYITDNSLIQKDLGWAPKKNMDHILSDTSTWIDKHSHQLKNILS